MLVEARKVLKADPPKPELARKYLDSYLQQAPHDIEALELRSKLLAESARNGAQVAEARDAADVLVRLDPNGPGRHETRRRLTELYLRMEQYVPQAEVQYRTAEAQARELIAEDAKAGKPDARDHRLLGQALLLAAVQGDSSSMPKAIAEFETAARLEPGDVPGAAKLAYLYSDRLKQPAKAEAVLDALLKANPSPEARLARYYHYVNAGLREKAAAELEQVIKAAPENLDVRLVAAEDALRHDDLAEARRNLDAIPEKVASRDVRARLLRGMLELRENHADGAIANWRQGLQLTSGNDPDLTRRLAEVLLQLGRLEDVKPLMDQYKRLTGGGPKGTPVYRFLEAIYAMKENQAAEAIPILEEIREELPEAARGQVYLSLGQCYEMTGNPAKALEAYREASKVAPNLPRPHLRIATLMLASNPGAAGREAAADELRRGLAKAPKDPELLLGVARLNLQGREWAAMKASLAQAEAVIPNDPALISLKADYLTGIGSPEKAAELLGQAAEKGDRRNAGLWIAWAASLAMQGDTDKALAILKRASAEDAAGDRSAIRIARARLQVQAGHGKLAREELDRSLNDLPPSERPVILRAKADLLAQQGMKAEALATIAQLANLLPDDPGPALRLLNQAVADRDEAAARAAVEALSRVKRLQRRLQADRPGLRADLVDPRGPHPGEAGGQPGPGRGDRQGGPGPGPEAARGPPHPGPLAGGPRRPGGQERGQAGRPARRGDRRLQGGPRRRGRGVGHRPPHRAARPPQEDRRAGGAAQARRLDPQVRPRPGRGLAPRRHGRRGQEDPGAHDQERPRFAGRRRLPGQSPEEDGGAQGGREGPARPGRGPLR